MTATRRRGASPEALGCATSGTPAARPAPRPRQAAPPPIPPDIVADLSHEELLDQREDDELLRDLDFASHDGDGRRKP